MLIGDTNTGRIGLDEEVPVFSHREEAWMIGLEAAGWHDGYRYMHGNKPAYTWYSPNGHNGFRLDEAFIHRSLIPRLHDTYYAWSSHTKDPLRRDAVSDHAAVIVELMTSGSPTNSKN
jgi:exonuclease III